MLPAPKGDPRAVLFEWLVTVETFAVDQSRHAVPFLSKRYVVILFNDSDEADILGLMIDEYEKKHYPIESPDPIEAIKIRMEEMQLKQIDLIDAIGGKSRVSEILNRKRKLTVEMIRKLTPRLNLSPGLLINDYQLTR